MSKTARKYVEATVSSLKGAAYNPARRTKDNRMRALKKSMERIGIICPIIITPENNIIEGHRRVAIAKQLKWETIPAMVVSGVDPKVVYQDVNTTSAKMNGNDTLGVWLKDPEAVTPRTRKYIDNMQTVIGRSIVNELYNAGMSLRTYRIAVQIVRLCDAESPELIVKVIRWLIQHSMVGRVMKAIEGGFDPSVILKAVKRNKPITMNLAVG